MVVVVANDALLQTPWREIEKRARGAFFLPRTSFLPPMTFLHRRSTRDYAACLHPFDYKYEILCHHYLASCRFAWKQPCVCCQPDVFVCAETSFVLLTPNDCVELQWKEEELQGRQSLVQSSGSTGCETYLFLQKVSKEVAWLRRHLNCATSFSPMLIPTSVCHTEVTVQRVKYFLQEGSRNHVWLKFLPSQS